MNKFFPLVLTGCAILIYSCGDSAKTTEETAPEAVDQSTAPQNVTPEAATPLEISGGDAAITAQPAGTMNPAPTAIAPAPAPSAAGGSAATGPLNPPHGEPGHRCEIAVGAPLNSAPAATPPTGTTSLPTQQQGSTTQQVQFQSSPQVQPAPASGNAPTSIMTAPSGSPAAAPATTTTAPGMNPPHGQPGHDCNIAVGAPLKK